MRAASPGRLVPGRKRNDAPTNPLISVGFDDYPDPDTVDSDGLMLTTAVYWIPGAYCVDLVDRVVTLRPVVQPDQRVGLYGPLEPRPPVARRLPRDRGPAAVPDRPVAGRPARPARSPTLADVQAIFTAHCAGGCHAAAPTPPRAWRRRRGAVALPG